VEITDEWDVPLMVTRGYPSMSFMYSAATAILDRGEEQRTAIYYFGDHDPSGVDIDRAVRRGIGEALQASVEGPEPTPEEEFDYWADFERIAVTEADIVTLDLPTRPTKKSDSRSKSFEGESVELDAIPANHLRRLVRVVIESQVDRERLDVLRVYEREEREGLERLAVMGLDPQDEEET
jgi:hypothetical protein